MRISIGVAAVAALLAICGCTAHHSRPLAQSPSPTPTSAPLGPISTDPAPRLRQPTASELEGVWKPVILLGKDVSRIGRINHVRPLLTFTHDTAWLTWSAFNGCQFESGRVRLGPSARFLTFDRFTNLNGCIGHVPHIATADVVSNAYRASLNHGRLTFYNKHGDSTGQFAFVMRSIHQTG